MRAVSRGLRNPVLAGILAGLVMAAIIAVMASINVKFAAPWTHTHTVSAQVTDADGISVSSDVRIAGRLAGQVTAITAQGDHSEVIFHVDDQNWPLPRDTTAKVRLATLLGQKYIQLDPGHDMSHSLADNAVIPLPRTRAVVDFDQLLDTFDKDTRTHLTNLIRTAGAAVQGQEGTIQQLIPDLRDLSVHSQVPTGTLAAHDADINNILINLGTTADTLNAARDDLAGVIDNSNRITATLATANGAALRGYIHNTDQVNQTAHAVLGNGGAAQLQAGFVELPKLVHRLDRLVTDLYPQTVQFRTGGGQQAALDLNLRIGDAISQSSKDGYFLRQQLQGIDLSGLPPAAGLPSPPPPPSSNPLTAPGLNLPKLVLPALPAIPSLPVPVPKVPSTPIPPCVAPPLPTLLPGQSVPTVPPTPMCSPTPPPATPPPVVPSVPPVNISFQGELGPSFFAAWWEGGL
ncbi:MAG: MlaD family protein [Candidatus Dormibacteria bacterium]